VRELTLERLEVLAEQLRGVAIALAPPVDLVTGTSGLDLGEEALDVFTRGVDPGRRGFHLGEHVCAPGVLEQREREATHPACQPGAAAPSGADQTQRLFEAMA
jgi:hypothetical protein